MDSVAEKGDESHRRQREDVMVKQRIEEWLDWGLGVAKPEKSRYARDQSHNAQNNAPPQAVGLQTCQDLGETSLEGFQI